MKLFLVFLALMFASCTAKNEQKPLSIQLTAEPVTLDFSKAEDGVSMRVLSLVMSGFTRSTIDNGLKNEIAKKIETKNGGKTLVVHLKEWMWSDGKPVTAQDFLYGIERTLNPKTSSKLSDLLYFIENAMEYRQGKIDDFSKVGVRARGANVLEFRLLNKFTFFPQILALSVCFPQRKDINFHSLQKTTGPYYVESWSTEKEIKLKRNPYYPEPFFGPDELRFVIVADENTALRMFENNQLDVVLRLPSFEIPKLLASQVAQVYPYFATYYLGFSQKEEFWKDVHARQAIAQAIDRDALVALGQSGEKATKSWIPKDIPGSNMDLGLAFNPKKAQADWKKATEKFADKGSSIPKKILTIAYDSSARNQILMQKVQADLEKNLGVRFNLENRDWKAYVQGLTHNTPAVFRFGFLSMFTDAFAHLFLFESNNPNNYTSWKSAKYDKLLRTISVLETGSPSRQKYVDEAQRLILEEQTIIIPLFHYVQVVSLTERAKNVKLNGLGHMFFAENGK